MAASKTPCDSKRVISAGQDRVLRNVQMVIRVSLQCISAAHEAEAPEAVYLQQQLLCALPFSCPESAFAGGRGPPRAMTSPCPRVPVSSCARAGWVS